MHKQWLDDVTNRTMLKVLTVAEADAKNQDKGLAEDMKYFAASISDAEKLMSNPDPPNEENDKPTQKKMRVDEDDDDEDAD